LTEQQAVRDATELPKPLYASFHERNLRVSSDFANAGHSMGIDVKERVTGIAAGERLPFAKVLGRLGG
jgi:hypothetical protein